MIAFSFIKAQVLDEYPKNQEFYEGGLINFYKEAHDYLINNNLKECDAKEIYQPRFLVTKDALIKLVKDSDTANISKNKCAYNISLEIFKNLKNWKPAEVKGGKLGALAEVIIYPKDIMSNYKESYNANNFIKSAQYPKGYEYFTKDFHDEFMSLFSDYHINGSINLEFYVDKDGHALNPRIYPEIRDQKFNIDFFRTFSRLKKTWKPALYLNIPIKEKIVYPMNFSTNFYER
ncbi:hypothetical protein GCM10022217_33050 [Chryseobacterium ginsenosidimutans]